MATKSEIKARYIENLRAAYPFYTDGSKPLAAAHMAADAALAGKMKLEGECWDRALASCGLPKNITMKALEALRN